MGGTIPYHTVRTIRAKLNLKKEVRRAGITPKSILHGHFETGFRIPLLLLFSFSNVFLSRLCGKAGLLNKRQHLH
jgi:hypothetical protein